MTGYSDNLRRAGPALEAMSCTDFCRHDVIEAGATRRKPRRAGAQIGCSGRRHSTG